jgi:hypothetical protein|tara:strand:- start:166 stop:408 length:243 start_codon:yes stop_codon:yes gene_type:complete
MILRELYYFDKESEEPTMDKSFAPNEESKRKRSDTRKVRLSLEDIKKARLATEFSEEEKVKELEFVRQMYGITANAAAEI